MRVEQKSRQRPEEAAALRAQVLTAHGAQGVAARVDSRPADQRRAEEQKRAASRSSEGEALNVGEHGSAAQLHDESLDSDTSISRGIKRSSSSRSSSSRQQQKKQEGTAASEAAEAATAEATRGGHQQTGGSTVDGACCEPWRRERQLQQQQQQKQHE